MHSRDRNSRVNLFSILLAFIFCAASAPQAYASAWTLDRQQVKIFYSSTSARHPIRFGDHGTRELAPEHANLTRNNNRESRNYHIDYGLLNNLTLTAKRIEDTITGVERRKDTKQYIGLRASTNRLIAGIIPRIIVNAITLNGLSRLQYARYGSLELGRYEDKGWNLFADNYHLRGTQLRLSVADKFWVDDFYFQTELAHAQGYANSNTRADTHIELRTGYKGFAIAYGITHFAQRAFQRHYRQSGYYWAGEFRLPGIPASLSPRFERVSIAGFTYPEERTTLLFSLQF